MSGGAEHTVDTLPFRATPFESRAVAHFVSIISRVIHVNKFSENVATKAMYQRWC